MALTKLNNQSLSAVTNLGMTKLETFSSTSSISSRDISVDYSAHTNFRLIMNVVGDASGNTDGKMTWKRAGQSSFDTSGYGAQGTLVDADANHLNENGTASYLYWLYSQVPNRGLTIDIWLNGIGSSIQGNAMSCITTTYGLNNGVSSYVLGGSYHGATNATDRVTDFQIGFASGNMTALHYTLYGMN